LRSEVARGILSGAELYLGAMAVPYALGLHEDYMMGCIEFMVEIGRITRTRARALKASNMHEAFARATGVDFSADLLQVFHLLRRMRNCQIHSGGRADDSLLRYLTSLDGRAIGRWRTFTHEDLPSLALNDEVMFTQKELAATLAVTKRLAEEANSFLAAVYPRDKWADQLVADWAAEHASQTRNRMGILRMARSYSNQYYRALVLTDAEVGTALERAGHRPWPREW
jgi:hypothetical protein